MCNSSTTTAAPAPGTRSAYLWQQRNSSLGFHTSTFNERLYVAVCNICRVRYIRVSGGTNAVVPLVFCCDR
jgi:hypothetical protein